MAQPHPFFLLSLPLILFAYTTQAEVLYTKNVRRAHEEFLKLKIVSGNNLIRQELQTGSNNALALLVSNYGDFLTLCVEQDPDLFDKLLTRQEQRLEQIEALPKGNTAWRDFAKAEVTMHIGLSKLLFGNKLSAAWDIRQAYLQYKSNASVYPQFLPNKKTLGMMQVLIGSVPDNYKWFLNIIGITGSVPVGMANLKESAYKENLFQNESKVLYALTLQLVDQKQEDKAINIIKNLISDEPDNLVYRFVAMHLLKKTKKADQALDYYQNRPKSGQYLTFPYLHHMAADLYIYKDDYEESIEKNMLFLKLHKGEHYIKAANYKLYLANMLSNHQPQALWFYKQIASVGKEEIEEDKYAARFVEKREKLDKNLMIARLRSDGGYYTKALKALENVDTTSKSPLHIRVEHLYRTARIYHGMDEVYQAIKYYKNTIYLTGSATLYFAPHAALQLGYIYQELNKMDAARVYFNKAMTYSGHDYKNSIDAKAKLALSAL